MPSWGFFSRSWLVSKDKEWIFRSGGDIRDRVPLHLTQCIERKLSQGVQVGYFWSPQLGNEVQAHNSFCYTAMSAHVPSNSSMKGGTDKPTPLHGCYPYEKKADPWYSPSRGHPSPWDTKSFWERKLTSQIHLFVLSLIQFFAFSKCLQSIHLVFGIILLSGGSYINK